MTLAICFALLQGSGPGIEMTAGGWAFMVCAWVFILALTFYTFGKVLGKK